MSADFEKVLVKDDRLDVKDVVRYAVVKGGQNVTCAQYKAISESNSQITFNIQVPSEQTIIDRRVLLRTKLTFVVKSYEVIGTAGGAAPVGVCYGALSALAPFPMHQLMTVQSATINNNTVSLNVRDALPALVRLLDKKELTWANSTTPTYADTLGSYLFNWQELNNPNAGYYNVNDTDVVPRGAFQLDSYTIASTAVAGTPGITTETFVVTVTEPLLLSPFIFGHPKSNSQGFYGIQNMNFVFNLGDTARFFRCPNAPTSAAGSGGFPALTEVNTYPLPYDAVTGSAADGFGGYVNQTLQADTGISLTSVSDSTLLFEFLTPHPSDMMPARNIVPFYELPRYISSFNSTVPAATYTKSGTSYALTPGQSGQVSAQSLQLNQIPDKLIIYARKKASNQNHGDADVGLGIGQISINFNNNSGILASATRQDLWQMSKHAGNNETWPEWEGEVSSNVWAAAATKLQPSNNLTTGFAQYASVGSYLVLEFGKDIQLVEDYYAPGSLGNFNLQVNLNVLNYNSYALTNWEIVIITMNSGVFVNERGTSSTYTGILTKQDVLEASQQQAYTKSDVARLVGGGFLDMVKSGVQKLAPIALPIAKNLLGNMEHPAAKAVSAGLGALGYGPSAGGPSAGGPSAGGPSAGRRRVDARLM